MRMKRGSAEDLEGALDLRKMSRLVDRVGEVFEEEDLTADEAVWAAALCYLSIYNSTDNFASSEFLGNAARALLKEAIDVFDSLPEPDDDDAPSDDDDADDDEEDEGDDENEELGDVGGEDTGGGSTEIPDADR